VKPTDLELESRLGSAVAKYLEGKRAGRAPPVAEFARGHPEIEEHLRACLEILSALPSVSEVGAELSENFGDFRLLRVLGRGGMGVVYEAEQKSLGRRVALKVLPPLGARDPERAERFRREVAVTARLQDPCIVPVFEHGQVAGLPYYVMPLLEGEALDAVLRRFRADPTSSPLVRRNDLALWVKRFAEVARALHGAHALGVVHRDVKPSNLFLDCNGRVLVLDFGLTRTSTDETLSGSAAPLGTPRYMSPEQILAPHAKVDGRSDLFSLAATLYELLTLRPAFVGEGREAVFRAILARDPVSARRLDPRVPRDLEVVVQKALEKEPARRYATAADFADDLERFLNYQPVRARPIGPLARLARRARRNPAAAGALFFAGAGLVASLAYPATQVLARERAVARLVFEADRLLASGEPDGARDRALRALAHDPSSVAARGLEQAAASALSARLEHERRAEAERAARVALEAARAARASAAEGDRRIAELHAELAAERAAIRPWSPLAVKGAVLALEQRERGARAEREQATRDVLAQLHTALQLDPREPAIRRELARFAFDEFVAAEKRRDRQRMQILSPLVEAYDDGSLARAWEGRGSVAIESDPSGADVFLFRFEEKDGLSIPVPHSPEHGSPPAYLDSIRTRGPWTYVRIAERVPCEDGGALLPGDLVVAICGDPPERQGSVAEHWCAGESHWLEVLREGRWETLRLRPDALEELPGTAMREVLFRYPCDAANRLGCTPLPRRDLPMGSYLVILRMEGFPDLRLPFEVARSEDEKLAATFFYAEDIGAGYAHVPAGPAVLGGDPRARSHRELEERWLPDFFMGRFEVTFAEYLEFVRALAANDPEGARRRLPQSSPSGSPLFEFDGAGDFRLGRGADEIELPVERDQPVVGITFEDAREYCLWLTERAGDPFVTYALPTEAEWEKAARGADGRIFPWGDGYDPTLARTGLSAWLVDALPGGLYPADESVYGVRDLVGNVREFCELDEPFDIPFRRLRGSSWYEREEADAHPANVASTLGREERDWPPRTGFRVVKRIAFD
jgi:formylglycine-generating enzyme required for sulfatase activity